MRKLLSLVVMLTMGLTMLMAQTKVISGRVLSGEDGEPIIGATVTVPGTTLGTVTDANGNFSLKVADNVESVQVSYVGMSAQLVKVTGKSLSVMLSPNEDVLDEVMVVAYGTTTKGTYTGSAATLKADKLEVRQVSDVSNALAGAVAGVQIQSNNGQPGTSATIKIRGVGSINASTTPLYVVDGVPFDGDLSTISSSDIESLTVLKDAASTSLYGARGANGIVMITTKKGKSGKAVVNLDAKWGVNSRQMRNYNVIRSAQEYLETEYSAIYNAGVQTLGYNPTDAWKYANTNLVTNKNGGSGYQVYTVPAGEALIGFNGKLNPNATLGYQDLANNRFYTPDNWEQEIFKSTLRQEYTLSIAGSTEKNNYYLSAGYLDDGGLVSGSGFERTSTRFKDEMKVKSWLNVGTNLSFVHSNSYYPDDQTSSSSSSSGNAFGVANLMAPIYPLYVRDADGNRLYNQGRPVYDYGTKADGTRDRSYMSISNPAGQLKYDKTEYIMDVFNGSWFAEITPLQGLSLRGQWSFNVDNTNYNALQNAYMGQFASLEGAAYQAHTRIMGFDEQYVINYAKTFAKRHAFDVTAGYDGYSYRYKRLYAGGEKLYNPESYFLSNAKANYNISGYQNEYATQGYFARVNYAFDERYIANAAVRRDASSRFAKDNRWGTFFSASAAWLISKEDFMADYDFIDMLKLKASYGQQGNDGIGNYYAYADQFVVTGDASGFSDGTLDYKGNKDLTWEKQNLFNVGIDYAFLQNKLSGSLEYFSRKSSDMLYYKPVAGSLGYSQIPMNVGSMTNSGFEFDVNYNIFSNKQVQWDVNFNTTHVKNKINELHKDLNGRLINGTRIYEEGESMYRMILVEWAGVDPQTGDALSYYNKKDSEGNITREKTKDYSIATQTENRVCTDDLLPKFYGGFGTTVKAFNFDFSLQLSYQLGGEIYDSGYASLMSGGNNSYAGYNWHKDIRNAWTTPGQKTDVPRLNAQDRYTNSTSTRFLVSSNYLSLNNITLGYSVPTKLISKVGLSKVRFYFVADNVALLSARKGLDPRQSYISATASTYSAIRTFSGGVSVAF